MTAASNVNLSGLDAFNGHLVVGGGITPNLPLEDTQVQFVTDVLTVSPSGITVNGDLTLLGSNIDLAGDVTADGAVASNDIMMIAAGDSVGSPPGNITAVGANITIQGDTLIMVAATDIANAASMNIDLDGGRIRVATGTGQSPAFGQTDFSQETGPDPQFEQFLSRLNLGTPLQLTFARQLTFGELIGLAQLAFIDLGLFEEDLSLYGIIGEGLALALAQCEELEGCAPDITPEELAQLIADLEARIAELERRLAEAQTGAQRSRIETLLAGYREQLENFRNYQQQLAEYLGGGDEGDLGEDEFGAEETPAQPGAAQVQVLGRILETAQRRVAWLQNLKADAENRARLGAKMGLELTIEAIDRIINATLREIRTVEQQIQMLLNGPQAMETPEHPPFRAETAGGYESIQTLGFGPSLLKLEGPVVARSDQWY